MRKTVVYAGVANLLQFRGQNVQMRNVGEFDFLGLSLKWKVLSQIGRYIRVKGLKA